MKQCQSWKELETNLSKIPFPDSLIEFLRIFESQRNEAPFQEFIFDSYDKGSHLQKLQILQILIDFFSKDSSRHQIFRLFFSESSRDNLLQKLSSLALGLSSSVLLDSIGLWMEEIGLHSSRSLRLTESLIFDYGSVKGKLENVASLSLRFAGCLIIAGTKLYSKSSPPSFLLTLFTYWISNHESLSTLRLGNDVPAFSLTEWTLFGDNFSICSGLHAGLLESLSESSSVSFSVSSEFLRTKVLELLEKSKNQNLNEDAMDRLGQFLTGIIFGQNLSNGCSQEIRSNLISLSNSNRLLSIVASNLQKEG